jgi:hypothetical protein
MKKNLKNFNLHGALGEILGEKISVIYVTLYYSFVVQDETFYVMTVLFTCVSRFSVVALKSHWPIYNMFYYEI